MNDLRHKDVWTLNYKGVVIEIVHFGLENQDLNSGNGIWNYYIYVYEQRTPHFERIWAKEKKMKMPASGREYISHDYYSLPLINDADWHGGITFYQKHGHSKGHRVVQIGCDFNHLWDTERGALYSLEEVLGEAKQTAAQLAFLLEVKQ